MSTVGQNGVGIVDLDEVRERRRNAQREILASTLSQIIQHGGFSPALDEALVDRAEAEFSSLIDENERASKIVCPYRAAAYAVILDRLLAMRHERQLSGRTLDGSALAFAS